MTGLEDRQGLIGDVEKASHSGARLAEACRLSGISVRTLQRWKRRDGNGDRRPLAVRPTPSHALPIPNAMKCWKWPTRHRLQTCHQPGSSRCWPTKGDISQANPAFHAF
jgi:hypothetical protein